MRNKDRRNNERVVEENTRVRVTADEAGRSVSFGRTSAGFGRESVGV